MSARVVSARVAAVALVGAGAAPRVLSSALYAAVAFTYSTVVAGLSSSCVRYSAGWRSSRLFFPSSKLPFTYPGTAVTLTRLILPLSFSVWCRFGYFCCCFGAAFLAGHA